MRYPEEKIIPYEKLADWRANLSSDIRCLVTTNGVFDILTTNHCQYLAESKKMGDCLLVGITNDFFVTKLKGPTRPVQKDLDRAFILANLQNVDFVTIFNNERATEFIKLARPNIHTKGGDFKSLDELPPEELTMLTNINAKIILINKFSGSSTTNIINKILS